jgi:hypothetical protein
MKPHTPDVWSIQLFYEAGGRFSLNVRRNDHSQHQVFIEPNTQYMRCVDCKGFEYRKTCEHLKNAVRFLHDQGKISDLDFKVLTDELNSPKRA